MYRPVRAFAPLALVAGLIGPASAGGPFTVTRTDDPAPDGCAPSDCSLREAIVDANAASGLDTIVLPAGTYSLAIPPDGSPDDGLDGDLDVFGDLMIAGADAPASIIDGAQVDRVFDVGSGISVVEISDVTVRNGSTSSPAGGGALANFGSAVTLRRVWITGHRATAGDGGAIANSNPSSVLTILDSALTGNVVSQPGGGDGGALTNLNGATANLTNVTISGNFANQNGGGMHNSGSSTIALTNVTVTDNTADVDALTPGSAGTGGIRSAGGTVSLANTILAGNHDGDPTPAEDPDCSGSITSGGNNLVGVVSSNCTFTPAGGDLTGVDPMLLSLGDSGGPTMTHALLPGSPAVDHIPSGCPPTDQRGVPRPFGAACDIGAYELALCEGVAVNRVGTDRDDAITGADGPDGVLSFDGNDSVSTGKGNDAVCAGDGNDAARGEAGKDLLRGGSGNDRLNGGPRPDRLFGEAGKDRLNGGTGKDRCRGGPGKDRNRKCEKGKP